MRGWEGAQFVFQFAVEERDGLVADQHVHL
jgi:hypothetical protein